MKHAYALAVLLAMMAILRLASSSYVAGPSNLPEAGSSINGESREEYSSPSTIDQSLVVRVKPLTRLGLSTIDYEEPFQVVLTNQGRETLHLWSTDSEQGYYQVVLHFTDPKTGEAHIARRRDIDDPAFWRAVAKQDDSGGKLEIGPGQSIPIEIELSGFAWGEREWNGLPSPNAPHSLSLSVEFTNPHPIAAPGQQVWRGSIHSQPIDVRFIALRFHTPHHYLWNGFPEMALEMMQADEKWIEARDEDQSTPLHHASRFGYAEVVEWLVEHGANVDSVAYNGFTPLYFAEQPEIVRVLLEGKPDLTKRSWQKTPLQNAVQRQVSAHNEESRQKWKEIAALYREAGASDDLMVAIYLDDLPLVQKILRDQPTLADAFQSESPLRIAADLGREAICRYLLENYEVDVDDFKRGTGYPIIKEALPYPAIVRLLIEHGTDLKTCITWQGGRTGVWFIGDDATTLHYAAADGVPETVTLLIDHGVDLFATTHDIFEPKAKRQTALDVASIYGRADTAAAILNHPKFVEADGQLRKEVLDRCLVTATRGGWYQGTKGRERDRPHLIELLLRNGAEGHSEGATPVQIAARAMHPNDPQKNTAIREAVGMLKAYGASIDLFSAVAIGDETAVAQRLKEDPKSANARGPDGYPALHFAVSMDYGNIVQQLLAAGCDIEIPNRSENTGSEGETALHCAAFWGRVEIAKALIAAGADVNARAGDQSTPLHDAAPFLLTRSRPRRESRRRRRGCSLADDAPFTTLAPACRQLPSETGPSSPILGPVW